MNIKQYKALFPFLMKANVPTITWGKHGIGKTEIHRQLAKELGLNFVYLTFGASEDVGDIIGLQDFNEVDGVKKATFVKPDWFPTTEGNLIFIDEFNRANKSILQAMYPFILEGKLGTHQLPKRSFVALAANPPTDEYTVTDVSDSALMSRMCHIKLEPTVDEWLEYARIKGLNRTVIEFVSQFPDHLHGTNLAYDLEIKPDNRAWEKYMQFLDVCTDTTMRNQVALGLLGEATAAAYMAFLEKFTYWVKAESIVNGLNASDIKHIEMLKIEYRSDALHNTNQDLLTYVKKEKGKLNDIQLENMLKYVELLPNDLAFNLSRELLENSALQKNSNVQQIIGENENIVNRFVNLKKAVKENL